MRFLLCEQEMGAAGEIEKPDTFDEINSVSRLMLFDSLLGAVLFHAPFCCFTVEEIGVDTSVELVDVHCVDAILEPREFGL